jgi:hypothetical protein
MSVLLPIFGFKVEAAAKRSLKGLNIFVGEVSERGCFGDAPGALYAVARALNETAISGRDLLNWGLTLAQAHLPLLFSGEEGVKGARANKSYVVHRQKELVLSLLQYLYSCVLGAFTAGSEPKANFAGVRQRRPPSVLEGCLGWVYPLGKAKVGDREKYLLIEGWGARQTLRRVINAFGSVTTCVWRTLFRRENRLVDTKRRKGVL